MIYDIINISNIINYIKIIINYVFIFALYAKIGLVMILIFINNCIPFYYK